MAGIAKITIIGNVGRPPQLRFSTDDTPVADFTVAVNKTRGGEQTPPTWYRITVWRRAAEVLTDILAKGAQVAVFGDFEPHSYVGNDGVDRVSFDISNPRVQLLGGKQAGTADSPRATAADEPTATMMDNHVFAADSSVSEQVCAADPVQSAVHAGQIDAPSAPIKPRRARRAPAHA